MAEGKQEKIEKSDAEWRENLSPEEYRITREAGTERAFSHALAADKRAGTYHCICCGEPVFHSATKYDSGTGWPSFWAAAHEDAVSENEDNSLFMRRTEANCSRCDAHLGHVFPDGPEPTGLRYCINGTSLELKTEDDESDGGMQSPDAA